MALDMLRTDVLRLEERFPGALQFIREANFRHECMRLAEEMTEEDVCEQSEAYRRFMSLIQRPACQGEAFKTEVERVTGVKIFVPNTDY